MGFTLEVFHLVIADADVYAAASEYMLEQVQVVGKALEVLEIVGLLAVSVTYTHPPVVKFRVVNADVNALLAVLIHPFIRRYARSESESHQQPFRYPHGCNASHGVRFESVALALIDGDVLLPE